MEVRNNRKTRQGVVVSNKMEKTIVVAAKFKEMHPENSYQKQKSTMFMMKKMSATLAIRY